MMAFQMSAPMTYLLAFAVVLVLVPLASRLAHRLGAVAHPRGDRWNRRSVPTLGGVALFGGIFVGVALLPLDPTDRLALLAGLTAMFLLGLFDDLRGSSALGRLAIEAVVGAGFVWFVSHGLTPEVRIAGALVGALAVPVAANATNLTDNTDGLAATLTIATAGTLAIAGTIVGIESTSTEIALVIAVCALGFLLFNRPPARVFMGDCGSLTVGFALAGVSVLIVRDALLIPGTTHVAATMIVPVAWAFQVGDLGMVVVTRMRRGVSPFSGGVDHTSHRLLAAGITPWLLLVGLGLLAAVVGSAAAIAAAFFGGFALMAIVAISLLLLVGLFEAAVAWRLPAMPAGQSTPTPAAEMPERAPNRPVEGSRARG